MLILAAIHRQLSTLTKTFFSRRFIIMSHQTESAPRTRLGGINDMIGNKVRIAARVLTYDADTGMAIVFDGSTGLLVDTELCLQERSFDWATERLTTVMVIGHLERSELVGLPAMPPHAPRLKIDQQLVLRAILIVHCPDLDLRLWNSVVEEEEQGQRS